VSTVRQFGAIYRVIGLRPRAGSPGVCPHLDRFELELPCLPPLFRRLRICPNG